MADIYGRGENIDYKLNVRGKTTAELMERWALLVLPEADCGTGDNTDDLDLALPLTAPGYRLLTSMSASNFLNTWSTTAELAFQELPAATASAGR